MLNAAWKQSTSLTGGQSFEACSYWEEESYSAPIDSS